MMLVVLCTASLVQAQERPKVGLVLSGGAAKGFAHIGVLKVFEEINMPIDVITGTSMGAVLGGVYASGYSAGELEDIAVTQDWVDLILREVTRRDLAMEYKRWQERYLLTLELKGFGIEAPSGVRSGQEVEELLRRITISTRNVTDFTQLQIPFGCVATDIVTGEAVELRQGDLVEAMRASMAIPSAFTPIEIDNHWLTDGGLVRNLPAQDAKEMGADIIIAVDVADPPKEREDLHSIFDILGQMMALQWKESNLEQYEYCDVVIMPDVGGLSMADFGKAKELIDLGEKAAREHMPRLRALADSLNALSPGVPRPERVVVDTLSIGAVRIEGLESVSTRVVENEVGLKYPVSITPDVLKERVGRVYSSGYFERVWYRIDPFEENATLELHCIEKRSKLFKIGLRYDSHRKAGLLLNTTFRNIGPNNSTWMLDLELGEETEIQSRYFIHTGLVPTLGLRVIGVAGKQKFDIYENGARVAQYQTDFAAGEVFLGTVFSPVIQLGVGLRAEYYDSKPETGQQSFPRVNERAFPAIAQVILDTTNETYYPDRGLFLDWNIEVTSSNALSDASYTRHFIDERAAVPVSSRLSVLQYLYLGTTEAGPAPLPSLFFLGGANTPWTVFGRSSTFLGLKVDERSGRSIQAAMLGLQYNISNMYLLLRWNAGNTFDEFVLKFESGRFINGGGLTAGMRLLNGMVEASFATSEVHSFLGYFTIGSEF